jgi:hypothetical protein
LSITGGGVVAVDDVAGEVSVALGAGLVSIVLGLVSVALGDAFAVAGAGVWLAAPPHAAIAQAIVVNIEAPQISCRRRI